MEVLMDYLLLNETLYHILMKLLPVIKKYLTPFVLMGLLLSVPIFSLAQQGSLAETIQNSKNAGIDESLISQLEERAVNRGINNEQLVQLLQPALALAEQDLPYDMIFNKALEGMAKNVPVSRIAPVLQRIGTATRQSAPLADKFIARAEVGEMIARTVPEDHGQFRNEITKSIASGLMKNIPAEEMSTLLTDIGNSGVTERTTPGSITSAVRIFGELPTTEQNPDISRSFILKSLNSGLDGSALQKLPGAMSVAQQRSQLPAARVIEGVTNQLDNGIPANKILQNLFNGNIGGGPPGSVPRGLDDLPGKGKGKGRGGGNNGNG